MSFLAYISLQKSYEVMDNAMYSYSYSEFRYKAGISKLNPITSQVHTHADTQYGVIMNDF